MRWQFSDANHPEDSAVRADYKQRIDRWWTAFQAQVPQLEKMFQGERTWDLPKWMAKHLHAIDPGLMWEFGPAANGDGNRLVITPESARHLRPLTNSILKRAPTIAGWEFYGHRLAESVEAARQTVEGRVGINPTDYQVQVKLGELNRVDLCYFSPSIPSPEHQESFHAAFVLSETLLGEKLLDGWIGQIEIAPLKGKSLMGSILGKGKTPTGLISLERMNDTVQAVIRSLHDQMPPDPLLDRIDDSEWAGFSLVTEDELEQFAQSLPEVILARDDLFVATSGYVELFTAVQSGQLFNSRRFSKVGEIFCYLKIDWMDGLGKSTFGDRSEIEDALDAALRPAKLGCTIGGGTGLRYSYIDLALTDVLKGLGTIRKVLQAGKVPRRSWIQFHDTDWCAEWVGVYSDSPAPPMPTFDA